MAKRPDLHLVQSNRPPTEGELSAMRDSIVRMKRHRELIQNFCAEYARHCKVEYQSYIDAGFTQAQALKLVAARISQDP